VGEFLSHLAVWQLIVMGGSLLVSMFYWWTRANHPAWFDFLYNFPIRAFGHIGKIKELKSNTEQVVSRQSWSSGMPSPESMLCNDYKSVMTQSNSPHIFNRAKDYLRLTYQNDVRPMPGWAWIVLAVLMVAESMGTGFLIAPFVSNEMTGSQTSYAGWVLAVVFALGLLYATHKAGVSTRNIMAIKNSIGNLDKNGKPHDMDSDDPITPTMDQDVDKGRSAEARYFRRAVKMKNRGSWIPTIGAATLLIFVLGTVFFVRYDGIKKQNTIDVAQMEKSGVADTGDSGNPFASASADTMPPEVAAGQKQAREKVAHEIGEASLAQGFGATILLSIIYLLAQAAGFGFAYKHTFVGEGDEAFQLTMGMPDYQSYHARFVLPYEGRAEARLAELRRHLTSVLPEYAKNPSAVMFRQYVNNQQAETMTMHEDALQKASAPRSTPVYANSAASVFSPSGGGMNYASAAESIMTLPEADRGNAMKAWLTENGAKHAAGLKEAITQYKANKAAQADDEMLGFLKD
jgi:hypothetical protein